MKQKIIQPEADDNLTSVITGFLAANRPMETKEDIFYWLQEAGFPINEKAHLAAEKFLAKKLRKKKKIRKIDFNRNHPELKKGEIFFQNIRKGMTEMHMGIVKRGPEKDSLYTIFKHKNTGEWDDFRELNFKTKRMGKKAYNAEGKIIPCFKPVFVKLKELKDQQYSEDFPFKDKEPLEIPEEDESKIVRRSKIWEEDKDF